MGHGQVLLSDTLAFDIQRRTWRKFHRREHRHDKEYRKTAVLDTEEQPQPEPRWKAAVSHIDSPAGMLVFGGDGETRLGREEYLDDAWALQFPEMSWELLSSNKQTPKTAVATSASESTAPLDNI